MGHLDAARYEISLETKEWVLASWFPLTMMLVYATKSLLRYLRPEPPFDDQGQPRIRIEAEAVERLLRAVGEGTLVWISSDVVLFEVKQGPDEERRQMLEMLSREATS